MKFNGPFPQNKLTAFGFEQITVSTSVLPFTARSYEVVAGFADKIDITEGVTGDATATLTPGRYADQAALATQVAADLNTAATDNTWTCTYSAATGLITIGHDEVQTGAIEWNTGASDPSVSAGPRLGYLIAADDTGGGSYPADSAIVAPTNFARDADAAYCTVEAFALRYRIDGGAPTATVGHLINVDESFIILGRENVINFRAIRDAASDAEMYVTYLKA